MNFAATLATNQKFNLRDEARPYARTPQGLLSFTLDRMTPPRFDATIRGALLSYVQGSGAWTGTDTQVASKAAGLAHLIAATGEYQLV